MSSLTKQSPTTHVNISSAQTTPSLHRDIQRAPRPVGAQSPRQEELSNDSHSTDSSPIDRPQPIDGIDGSGTARQSAIGPSISHRQEPRPDGQTARRPLLATHRQPHPQPHPQPHTQTATPTDTQTDTLRPRQSMRRVLCRRSGNIVGTRSPEPGLQPAAQTGDRTRFHGSLRPNE